jgi:hypothetical protein
MSARSLAGDVPEGRPEHDFYPTPPVMTEKLTDVEMFFGHIWEPACGDGAMGRVFDKFQYKVTGTDIEPRGYGTYGNFLETEKSLGENIVTNPPFKLLNQFIVKALSFQPSKLCLLAKIQALATQERSHVLEQTHLTRVHVFRARYTMWRNGVVSTENGGTIEYCWLVWEKGYTGKPVVDWI